MAEREEMLSGKLGRNFQENVAQLDKILAAGISFDVHSRPLEFGQKKIQMYFVDGLVDSTSILDMTRILSMVERNDLVPATLHKLVQTYLSHGQVTTEAALDKIASHVLAGRTAFIVEGEQEAIIVEARRYPARGPEEPDLEKVVRGSRDGFTETIIFNTALIRRRIRDPKLRFIMLSGGKRSKSDICLAYIEDIASPELVADIKRRLEKLNIDGLPMAEKSVEEMITKEDNAWNPFPQVRYTERPDVAAAHLLEGHVLIMVDTSPSIMIAPTTFFHHVQHAEEYRQAPIVGAYIRWVRLLAIVASLVVVPLWLLFSLHPGLLPKALSFIGPKKIGNVPLILQFLIAEVSIDVVRMAAIHTPSPLTTSLGLIAALMIGEVAINIGMFAPEVIMYMAIAATGTFATPSYELGMALRLWRYLLIILVYALSWPGLVLGVLALFVFLARSRSFGVPYLWPLIPFNWTALKAILIRYPVPIQNSRPSILKPVDTDRQPGQSIPIPSRKPQFGKGEKEENEKD
ncbi:stage V sporulation protein AF [Carboxydocella thermautotrophica]|nr:stage V sporulation protein AF [Carboxydocella thermautotrophica]